MPISSQHSANKLAAVSILGLEELADNTNAALTAPLESIDACFTLMNTFSKANIPPPEKIGSENCFELYARLAQTEKQKKVAEAFRYLCAFKGDKTKLEEAAEMLVANTPDKKIRLFELAEFVKAIRDNRFISEKLRRKIDNALGEKFDRKDEAIFYENCSAKEIVSLMHSDSFKSGFFSREYLKGRKILSSLFHSSFKEYFNELAMIESPPASYIAHVEKLNNALRSGRRLKGISGVFDEADKKISGNVKVSNFFRLVEYLSRDLAKELPIYIEIKANPESPEAQKTLREIDPVNDFGVEHYVGVSSDYFVGSRAYENLNKLREYQELAFSKRVEYLPSIFGSSVFRKINRYALEILRSLNWSVMFDAKDLPKVEEALKLFIGGETVKDPGQKELYDAKVKYMFEKLKEGQENAKKLAEKYAPIINDIKFFMGRLKEKYAS